MTGADWLIVATLLLSVVLAAAQGFWVEIFSLAGVVIGYVLAAWGYARTAPWFLPYVREAWIADLAGFLTIFFVVLLLAGMAGSIARWAMKEAGLRWVDRMLGAAFGLVRGVVMVAVVVTGVAMFTPESPALQASRLAGYFLVAGHGLSWVAPASAREKFRHGVQELRKARRQPAGKPSPP